MSSPASASCGTSNVTHTGRVVIASNLLGRLGKKDAKGTKKAFSADKLPETGPRRLQVFQGSDPQELVDKLVLGVTLSRTNDAVREAVDFWTDAAEHGDWNAIVQDMMGRMYSERYAKRYGWLFPLLLKTVKLSDPARFATLARSCLTCESYGRLDHIACPTLVLGASEDRIVTAEASREIAERIGCPLHIYEGFGHSAYEEAPDFNRRIYDFLMQL